MFKACLLTTALLAQQGADPAACALIVPDDVRPACYDGHFRGPPAGEPRATDRQKTSPRRRPRCAWTGKKLLLPCVRLRLRGPKRVHPGEEFGLTPAQLAERDRGAASAKVLNRIEARVVSVEHTDSGYTVLKLDNGQQWTDVSRPSAHSPVRAT